MKNSARLISWLPFFRLVIAEEGDLGRDPVQRHTGHATRASSEWLVLGLRTVVFFVLHSSILSNDGVSGKAGAVQSSQISQGSDVR